MNILQIANKAIYPPDGGSLAVLSLSKGYIKNGHQVHILNMVTHKHTNNKEIIEDEYRNNLKITGVKINSRISFVKILLNLLFSKKPYISERFVSSKFKSTLKKIIGSEEFGIVQLEGLYILQYIHYIRKFFKGNIIYRPHNLEYLIWERNAKAVKPILKKMYYNITSNRLKRLETKLINTYGLLVPITKTDANSYAKLGNTKPVIISPFGIDITKIEEQATNKYQGSSKSLLYIGALDWIPNQQGLVWFIEKCLPIIMQSHPEIELKIAGRKAPNWLVNKFKHSNIKFYGEIENSYSYLQQQGPVIVPLYSGSGMRVKIIEAMALKKAIVATPVAAEGISCVHNENIMIANTPESFTKYILRLIDNNNLQNEIGENAFHFVRENYNFTTIASNIINHIK